MELMKLFKDDVIDLLFICILRYTKHNKNELKY